MSPAVFGLVRVTLTACVNTLVSGGVAGAVGRQYRCVVAYVRFESLFNSGKESPWSKVAVIGLASKGHVQDCIVIDVKAGALSPQEVTVAIEECIPCTDRIRTLAYDLLQIETMAERLLPVVVQRLWQDEHLEFLLAERIAIYAVGHFSDLVQSFAHVDVSWYVQCVCVAIGIVHSQ